ncbi:LuxR C-terminal-related transcriptional regulator [Streptomyces xanthii]|uniref:Helix-turn-helix transcriptional regulator n=1 Tax=Streptomyces xanthii TaxID=2768069 RepID=A0A7H1B2S7_9ACTN|nr:LuxR C-terminal-related transcriptional regulator [Streptomyces xanthii]QNS03032.1 helix-turn-helix transcriptional regulator [Streptomyces xanthii]
MSHASRGGAADGAAGALTPSGEAVLASRFTTPRVPATFVRRTRLTERLTRAQAGPDRLTLVSGPAGAGKTLLVADWARTCAPSGPVVWLTVESGDNDPGNFWTYVLAALRHHGLTPSGGLPGPARPGEAEDSVLTRLAAYLNSRTEPVILVLDECERISSPEVAGELDTVLRHAGGGLRLVLLSRTEPPLPLHRYRAAGEMTDLRAADLAFLPEETAELARRHGMPLPDEAARSLTARTEGWAAGLRLGILDALRTEDPRAALEAPETWQGTVADYLVSEVLDAQSPAGRDLLLRTCVCERIRPGLANALTGRDDAAAVLAQLRRANAFVEPAGRSGYRLHPLFAEVLRARLSLGRPGSVRELHRTAARWLSDAGLLTEALPHAAEAGDWAFAAGRVVHELAIGRLLTGPDAARLGSLFAAMPPDTPGPAAELVRAARALSRHDAERALAGLGRAESLLPPAGTDDAAAAHLTLATLRVLAGRQLGSSALAESADRRAEELAGRELVAERLAAHPELRVLRLSALGSAQLWAGRFAPARAALTAAVRASGASSTASLRHDCLGRLALIEFLDGWPGRAEAHALQAITEGDRSGLPPSGRTALGPLVLASVDIERDDLASARAHVHRASPPSSSHDAVVASWLAVTRSRLLSAGGDPVEALHALGDVREPPSAVAPPAWVDTQVAVTAATAHLARGRPWDAVNVLARCQDARPEHTIAAARARLASGDGDAARSLVEALPGPDGHGPALTVRSLLVRAEVAGARGDGVTAGHLVARALALARPERLRRPFLEAGPWLRTVLGRRPALARTHTWLPDCLLPEEPPTEPGGSAPAPVVEPLSDRELEVLERLAQMMSTEEIATELFLSVNTVKTHLRNIYRKLAAARRGEAVRRARELRLL